MFFDAKNGCINVNGAEMDYIAFGKGEKNLVMLPGAGDGLKTAKGLAIPFSILFRQYAKDFRVYVFSRRNNLPEGFSTKDMAEDVVSAMDYLDIPSAGFLGVSQGGMISQQVAIHHPDKVNKLVLAVTSSKPNALLSEVISQWIEWAKTDDYKKIMIDMAVRSYTGRYQKISEKIYKMLGNLGKPKDFARFIIICQSCIDHNAYDVLEQIKCPVYIIGAGQDQVLGVEASREIAGKIEGSELYIYDEYSHGVYDQAKDFHQRILEFMKR